MQLKKLAILFILTGFGARQCCALTPVPDGLPAGQSAAFKLRYLKLTGMKDSLNSRIEQFKTKCGNVPEDKIQLVNECEREQAELNGAKANYYQDADAYEHDLAAAVSAELNIIASRVTKTRKELERVSSQLSGFQAAVEEWTNLAGDARNNARKAALESVASVLLERLSISNEMETQLDEESLKRINVLLRNRVFMDDLYAQVLTAEKIQSLKTELDFINLLKRIDGTMALAEAMESKERVEVLKVILKGIETVDKDPAVALLITDGEITIDAAYGWLANREAKDRINQLLNLNEDQFKAVKILTALYKRDIDNRRLLMAAHSE
jgi:hypothetical protein